MKIPLLFQKDAFRAIVLAIVLLVVGELILAWQYYRLEEKRVGELEQKVEENAAQNVLESFIEARISQNELKINRYLTENANEQKIKGEFLLSGEFVDYKIHVKERVEEEVFRFQVEIFQKDRAPSQVENIRLTKILGEYYIDSVEIAG